MSRLSDPEREHQNSVDSLPVETFYIPTTICFSSLWPCDCTLDSEGFRIARIVSRDRYRRYISECLVATPKCFLYHILYFRGQFQFVARSNPTLRTSFARNPMFASRA